MSGPRVQVLLFVSTPQAGPHAVTDAYHQISSRLVGTAGLLRNTLLQRADAPEHFIVASEWKTMDAFRHWEQGAEHRSVTAPLRGYQDHSMGAAFGIYTVAAEYVDEQAGDRAGG